MRKLTVLFLVGLMFMAFGVTAYAQPKVTLDITGFIDFAGIITKNITDQRQNIYGLGSGAIFDPNAETGFNKTGAFANSRARLKFTANAGKELKGVIFFEMDSSTWVILMAPVTPWATGTRTERRSKSSTSTSP
jgi:hypothetical protein